jgi:hypothetical protein
MIRKKPRNTRKMAKKITMMLAAVIFVLECFAGIDFSVFNSNSTSDDASNSDTIIDYIHKANALEVEVLNNSEQYGSLNRKSERIPRSLLRGSSIST